MSDGFWQMSDEQLLHELVELETRMRVNYAHNLALIGELATRDRALKHGYPQLPILLRDTLRITRRDATRRIQQAAALGETAAVSGARVPPLLPATAAAAQAGLIGPEQIVAFDAGHEELRGQPVVVGDDATHAGPHRPAGGAVDDHQHGNTGAAQVGSGSPTAHGAAHQVRLGLELRAREQTHPRLATGIGCE